MGRYQIHRMKKGPQESFRWMPHTGGETAVKLKDYESGDWLEAATPYAAWRHLADEGEPLRPGDLLEEISTEDHSPKLLIYKYIGFEPAQWTVPEVRPEKQVYEAEGGPH